MRLRTPLAFAALALVPLFVLQSRAQEAPLSAMPAVFSDTPQTAAVDPNPPAEMAKDPEFLAAVASAVPLVPAAYDSQPYRLRLHHTHTLEDLEIVYRIGDNYQPEAIARLDYFLRDHRTYDVKAFDPREFDLLHDILIRLDRPNAEIDIVCGYRTQWSNDFLRASSRGVAEHSQHVLGHAIDIQVPGSSTARLRDAALALNEGGVGYYPVSHFVHVDVGAIRTWTYSPHRARRGHAHLRSAATRRGVTRRHHVAHAAGV